MDNHSTFGPVAMWDFYKKYFWFNIPLIN